MTVYKIKTEDVCHNYRTLCDATEAAVVPMLKANGYGLGAQGMVDILSSCGAERFAFSRLEEAMAVTTDKELWVLSCYHTSDDLTEMIRRGIVMAADSLEQCKLISALAQKENTVAHIHLAVDTGFGRFGFAPDQLEKMEQSCKLDNLSVEGIFSHLGAAFFYKDSFADEQLDCFLKVVKAMEERGITFTWRHIANSSALLRDQKFHLNAVRVGSALLGRLPVAFNLPLKRVGKLESEIIDIRPLVKGHNIGYGKVYRLGRDSRVAVVAAGSADGVQLTKDYDAFRFRDFCRYGLNIVKMMLKKDNRMRVRVNGQSAPVLGRVALTHTFVDVTNVECKAGDCVEIPISPLYVAGHIPRIYE
ncbi:MAG: alanine racemase [Clostridia bacterium]|nr:alanine racemase [Clostridia bacterium]